MSISSAVRKAGPFVGNGVTTAFPFAFKVFSTADLLVVRADTNGAEYTLVLGTDYTVTLNADQNASPGGTVTKTSALATDDRLAITSQVVATQPTVLTNSGGFYPAVINDALDRLTILAQQLSEEVSRAIKTTITSELDPDEFVANLQQGASEAAISAAAAAASALEAEASAALVDGANIVHRTGAESVAGVKTFTDKPVVPAGATGAEVPQAQETVLKTGGTMTGPLVVPAGATGAQVPQAQEVVGITGSTGSAKMPVGTTAEWDVTPAAGFTRVNSETDQLEFHNGTDIVFTRKHQAARFATTSGTSFDITDIPDWVTQIDIVPRGVSLSGTDSILIQLGGAAGFLVTGYSSTSIRISSAASATGDTNTTGFVVSLGVAGNTWTGRITIHKVRDGSRAFVQDHTGKTSTSVVSWGGGDVVMTEELTQIRIKTDGANSFDAGEVIVYWS